MKARRTGLATRLMTAQVIVIAVGAATLLLVAAVAAPVLFTDHLSQSGETDPAVIAHAEEAFNSAFMLSLVIGSFVAVSAAGVMSWLLVRRVAPPLENLARAAESVANGNYDAEIPNEGFGSELQTLSSSFARMSHRLQEIDASRSRMLNDLAHEIRTPLATLEVFVDGMEDEVVPIDTQTYTVLHSQIARLQRLAHDVRDAANVEEHALTISPRTLDLAQQTDIAVQLAYPQFKSKGVTLTNDSASTLAPISADEERLQQVLTNVLSNALRHTPTGGHVTLTARNDGDHVRIQVSDDGDGIAPDQLDEIFERFYRGDPSRTAAVDAGGSGLGLTIARAITTQHGGTIMADSPGLGQGTIVTIRLPSRPKETK